MSDEAAFLRAIQANPTDATAKLVYADWLDEHGESEKAEYLRLDAKQQTAKKLHDGERRRLFDLTFRHYVWTELLREGFPSWDDVTLFTLGRLRGLLDTFATLNSHESNIAYDFDADLVPNTGVLAEVVNGSGGNEVRFELEPLADWETGLRGVLHEWLFYELRHLTDAGHDRLAWLTVEGRERQIDLAMAHVRAVINPMAGWRLRSTGRQRRGIDWADIALEAADRVLFLHFNFDD